MDMLWESVLEHGFQWNLTFDQEYGVGLWQVGSMYYLSSVNSLSKASLLLVSYPQQKHVFFFSKCKAKSWPTEVVTSGDTKLQNINSTFAASKSKMSPHQGRQER